MTPTTEAAILSREVLVIGEYTSPSGPWADDHFLVAIFRSGQLVELPSSKADQMIAELQSAIGRTIEFRLCNRTDSASRVMFPPALEGKPLFEFTQKIGGFLGLLRIVRSLGVMEASAELTSEVKQFVAENSAAWEA